VVKRNTFCTSALDGSEWSDTRPTVLSLIKEPVAPTFCEAGSRAGLDVMMKR